MKNPISKYLSSQSDFSKNVIRLSGSSLIAVIISFLSLPIITRIYQPEDFGQFQVLLSTVGLMSVISSFRYEMAIVLPKGRSEASAVYTLSLLLLLLTTAALVLALYFFGSFLMVFIGAEVLLPYMFLLVIAVFFSGLVQIIRFALTRERAFKELGNNRVVEAASAQGLKIGLGVISPTFLSLFISQLVGYLLSLLLAKRHTKVKLSFSWKRIFCVFRKYRKFLIFNTPAVFVNTLALQLPVFMIAKYFGTEQVGYYVLAVKLIEVPLRIVSNAISQVYFKQAADTYRDGAFKLLTLYKSTVLKLAAFMIIPSVLVFFLAEPVVPLILGNDWEGVGAVMKVLIFWKFFEFINYPVSTTLTVIDEQHFDFILKIMVSLGGRIFAIVLFHETFQQLLYAVVVSASFYYLLFNYVAYSRVKKRL